MINPLFRNVLDLNPYDGVRIIERPEMLDTHEDWSRVRSPSRARRRRRQGHRQNIAITYTPKKEAISTDGGRTLYMHPAMADALRRELRARGVP